jgi:hypothetical protein
MQLANMASCVGGSSLRQSVQQVCRLQPGATTAYGYNSRRAVCCPQAVAGSLRSIEQDAVKVSIPDRLPTNGLKKGYSTVAEPAVLPADIKRVLFSQQQVQEKVAELAAQICRDYRDKPLAVIGVLNGAFIFTSGEKHKLRKPAQLAAASLSAALAPCKPLHYAKLSQIASTIPLHSLSAHSVRSSNLSLHGSTPVVQQQRARQMV